MENLRKKFPRYIRDQAAIIGNIGCRYDQQDLDSAIQYCTDNEIYKATDFEPVLKSLQKNKKEAFADKNPPKSKLQKKYNIIPQTSKISDYKQILDL